MPSDGIVIVGSAPAMPNTPPPPLFAITPPIAPATCMFLTLIVNAQVPRSASPTLPVMEPAGRASQASLVDAPAPSFASTRSPVVPATVSGAPKAAAPAAHSPGVGELMIRIGTGTVRVEQAPTVRTGAGASVPSPLIMSIVSPQMSE